MSPEVADIRQRDRSDHNHGVFLALNLSVGANVPSGQLRPEGRRFSLYEDCTLLVALLNWLQWLALWISRHASRGTVNENSETGPSQMHPIDAPGPGKKERIWQDHGLRKPKQSHSHC
jgi:hypothetical protein